ncbi:lipase [Wenzhouxiangella sp. AB-CW3]|uniref:lipase n=1 Tax=Wenzhouxiangella sp. AB-CW3 TaxID=2771012 RepID=UPI00168A88DF|nr:lipase [Wenzhouxiangella sp. AB-CW3]QOC22363.1 lipase [Wenzhouxiangella sp. AB-CW3]
MMKSCRYMALALVPLLFLVGCGGSSDVERATPAPPVTNPEGRPVDGVITARFDPGEGDIPFPNSLLLQGTADLTLNLPVDDPTDFSNPQVALSKLDGFSTVAPWTFSFSTAPDPDSIVPGSSVRFYEVSFAQGTAAVTGVNRELVPGQDYVATIAPSDPTGRTVAIVPLRPLQEMTGYMAVVTDGIRDERGNPATAAQPYHLSKRPDPLVDEQGQSTDPLLDNETAGALEGLRQLTNTHLAAAGSQGVDPDSVVLSFTATTQSITPVLERVRSAARPTSSQIARACVAPDTCLTTADVLPPGASPGIADLYIGVVELPYYLGIPEGPTDPTPLSQFWQAEPGAYVPPFDDADLDPNSTSLTVANPMPVETGRQIAPVLMSVPNEQSGFDRPTAGWPVVIFQHGITGDRSQMLALADAMATIGFAVVAIDMPLHGITETDPSEPLGALYVGNTPFGEIATERTFDLRLGDGQTIDDSGEWFINLQNLLVSRDNLRQAQVDLSTLALNIPQMDLTGDGVSDLDGSSIQFVGLSLGGMVGTPFLAVEDTVNNGVLSASGGGIANLLAGSDTFGPVIRAGLEQAGVEPFSPDYYQFLLAAQTVIDAADPINWGAQAVLTNSVLIQQIAGDAVVPNAVSGAPLSGTEPLIAVMGLDPIVETTTDPMGIRGAVRMLEGGHGSLLDPGASPAATAELQGQAASMAASGGAQVVIGNPTIIQTD